MKLLLKKKSVFTKLLFTYCVLCIVSTCSIGLLAYLISTRSYEKRLEQNSAVLLEQYKALVETEVVAPAQIIVTDLMSNEEYKEIYDFFQNDPTYNDLLWYHKELQRTMIHNSRLLRDIWLYVPDKGMILSAQEGLILLDTRDGRWWALEEDLTERNTEGWSLQYRDSDVAGLRFRIGYPWIKNIKPIGYIVEDIELETPEELLRSLSVQQAGELFLLDEEDQLIPVTGEEYSELFASCDREDGQSGKRVHWEGEDYYITFSSPLSNGWRLAMTATVTDFYASVTYLQRMIFCITVLCILLGIAVSVVLSRRVYGPVKGIVRRLNERDGSKSFSGGNEYEFIDSEILHLGESIQELTVSLESYKPILEYNTVSRMINGTLQDMVTWNQRLEMLGLQVQGDSVMAVVVRFRRKLLEVLDEKNQTLFKIRVIGVLRKACGGRCIVSECDLDEIAAIVFAGEGQADSVREGIRKEFQSNLTDRVMTGIGEVRADPMEFGGSYQEACEALQYAYYDDTRMWYPYPAFAQLGLPEEDVKGNLCRDFDRLLKLGEREAVFRLLEQTESTVRTLPWHYQYLNEMLLGIMQVFTEYCSEMNIRIDSDSLKESFLQVNDLKEFYLFFEGLLSEAFSRRDEFLENRNEQMVSSVCDYIDSHLQEDISLAVLAERAGISEGHLSRMFRSCRGRSVVDYITAKRMEEAKRLLEETDLGIDDISQRCGYRTLHYFGKKFKETYGDTPSRYRERRRQRP